MAGKRTPVAPVKVPVSRKVRARFTVAQKNAIRGYVELAAMYLRLNDWTITVDFDTEAPEAIADMNPLPNSKHATLRLGAQFKDLDARMQSQTLIHELVHCHLFGLHGVTETLLANLKSSTAVAVANGVLNDQVEQVTDALADVLVDLLPELSY